MIKQRRRRPTHRLSLAVSGNRRPLLSLIRSSLPTPGMSQMPALPQSHPWHTSTATLTAARPTQNGLRRDWNLRLRQSGSTLLLGHQVATDKPCHALWSQRDRHVTPVTPPSPTYYAPATTPASAGVPLYFYFYF